MNMVLNFVLKNKSWILKYLSIDKFKIFQFTINAINSDKNY